jgi:hypothetical protein
MNEEKNKALNDFMSFPYVGEGIEVGNWWSSQHKKGCASRSTGLPACGCCCDCGLGHITQNDVIRFYKEIKEKLK